MTSQAPHDNDPFPLDRNLFRRQWRQWIAAGNERPVGKPILGYNILADTILAVWKVGRLNVELSAVIMPNFGQRPREEHRYIGLSIRDDKGVNPDLRDFPLIISTWNELETALNVLAHASGVVEIIGTDRAVGAIGVSEPFYMALLTPETSLPAATDHGRVNRYHAGRQDILIESATLTAFA